MKYFLPELYVRFQSRNDDEADAADEAWDAQCDAYQERQKEIRGRLPRGVRTFQETVNLHDAVWHMWSNVHQDDDTAQLVIRQYDNGPWNNYIAILRYKLIRGDGGYDGTCHKGIASGAMNVFWLYDEFDEVGDGLFSHSILCSDGREHRFLFTDFEFVYIPLHKMVESHPL
jgi:hypothetical protein